MGASCHVMISAGRSKTPLSSSDSANEKPWTLFVIALSTFFPLYIYAILPLPQGELHVAHHDFTLPNLPFSADTE